jgi:hypothetical protein
MVKKRLGYDDAEFDDLMTQPIRTYRDFATYKTTFERMRPIFSVLAQRERIPRSFYMRYTLPDLHVSAERHAPLAMEPMAAGVPQA